MILSIGIICSPSLSRLRIRRVAKGAKSTALETSNYPKWKTLEATNKGPSKTWGLWKLWNWKVWVTTTTWASLQKHLGKTASWTLRFRAIKVNNHRWAYRGLKFPRRSSFLIRNSINRWAIILKSRHFTRRKIAQFWKVLRVYWTWRIKMKSF